MNIEDIKVGETYNVRMKCVEDKERGLRSLVMETMPHIFRLFDKRDIETCVFPLLPPETAPKYDPCRKFRKGDKAKPRRINGRECKKLPLNVIFTVIGDEDEYGAVSVEYMSPTLGLPTSATVHAVWLELLTPAEYVEPYSIKYIDDEGGFGDRMEWRVVRSNCCVETFPCGSAGYYSYKQAKARAEQECARLNTEWRKEKNNA